jgi:hypothetical protein
MCRGKARVTETVKKGGYPATFDGAKGPNNKEIYNSHFSNSEEEEEENENKYKCSRKYDSINISFIFETNL